MIREKIEWMAEQFAILFGKNKSLHYFFAPGRVNLIGEHTDYNGGNVFPFTLNLGIYAAVSKCSDRLIRCYSSNFSNLGIIQFSLDDLMFYAKHHWANYPKGVFKILKQHGYILQHGLDIFFSGNIPNGAGLSSSASIEVLTAIIIKHYGNYTNLDNISIALYCQQSENQFIGVNCGIMDQFAIAMGQENHAILLDCNTLNYQYTPLNFSDFSIVIANTNKKRALADSKYNERKQECDNVLLLLQKQLKIKSLCDLIIEEFLEYKDLIKTSIEFRRAFHAISENQRTIDAVKALQNNDFIVFGQLMTQSHISLRDNYEVTGFELDSLVDAAWSHNGCYGSRMTGAGFGGCTINLVQFSQVRDFIDSVGVKYLKKTGIEAEFYIVKAGHGARLLS